MNYCTISVDVSLHKNDYGGLGDGQKLGLCVWLSTSKATVTATLLPSDVGFTLRESAVTGDLAPRNVLVSET